VIGVSSVIPVVQRREADGEVRCLLRWEPGPHPEPQGSVTVHLCHLP
jgi:hypothetical protein